MIAGQLHAEAIAAAAEALASEGFTRTGDRTWTGIVASDPKVLATLELSADFPFALPEVRLDRRRLPRRIPHVEKSGKICIAPDSGIQLVTDRPGHLVLDALERAKRVVQDGLHGVNSADLQREFLAYWREHAETGVYSICATLGPSRDIIRAEVAAPHAAMAQAVVFADTHTQLRQWIGRLGGSVKKHERALFLHLAASFDPPDFDDDVRVDQSLAIIQSRLTADDRRFFERLLDQKLQLPLYLVVSMPLPFGDDRVVFALRVPRSGANDHGFRPGQVPLRAAIARSRRESIVEISVHRLDAAFVLERGGGQPALMKKRVALIGCGAVGGAAAMHLAAAGVGVLHLIDPDSLSTDNIQRHVLGIGAVDASKVEGLRRAIGARFPHVEVTIDASKVQDALKQDKARISGADLVMIAVGDPTLESWLNRALHELVRRVHVWIEPYGLGGHVLLTGSSKATGCFECVLDHGDDTGVRASLAAGSQDFGVSFSGCAGTFTPYGELDADRAAIEATRVAIAALRDREPDSLLVTWMEEKAAFEGRGYQLSPRGRTFSVGERRRETRFVNLTCIVCSS